MCPCQLCESYDTGARVSLLCDAFERLIVVETKVARVDDVVGFGIACKLVQLSQVALSYVSHALTVLLYWYVSNE